MTSPIINSRNVAKVAVRGGGILGFAVLFQFFIGAGTQVILARILEPELFGTLAFVMTVGMVLASASNLNGDIFIVYYDGNPKRAANVVFTVEVVTAVLGALLMIGIAPLVMELLGKPELTIYVQFLTVSYLYAPLSRPRALYERDLQFAKSRTPVLIGQVLGAIVAIVMATQGAGIWSLLIWRIAALATESAILWIFSPHRLRFAWSPEIARLFIRYSWPLTGSALLLFIYSNVDYLIVGQFLVDGPTQLGFYWLGFQVSTYFLMARQVLMQTLFPIFTRINDESTNNTNYQLITHTVAGVTLVPTLIALFFGGELINLVYGSKWAPAVFPFQVVFVAVLVKAISANLGYFLYAKGKTESQFQSALIYTILLVPLAYFATINYGIDGTAVSVVVTQTVVSIFVFEKYSKPAMGHGFIHFFWRPMTVCAMAAGSLSLVEWFDWGLGATVLLFLAVVLLGYKLLFRATILNIKTAWSISRAPSSVSAD